MITAAILLCLAPAVSDGDSLRCGTSPTTVRLFGVRSVDGTPADAAAAAALAQMVGGGLICEPRGTSYSRIVAICRNAQGLDVGGELIRSGKATEWCQFSRNAYGTCATTP